MPEIIHVSYNEADDDVFVMENLLADSYVNYDGENSLDMDHMKSVLECLGQLHGTGIGLQEIVGNGEKNLLKQEFPELEEQIQLKDLLDNSEMRAHLRFAFFKIAIKSLSN